LLGTAHARDEFERMLEKARRWYEFYVYGYVVMPEHIHLLISEPERGKLSVVLQMLKQSVARELRLPEGNPFWQARHYDFNVRSDGKRVEKLRYISNFPASRAIRGKAGAPVSGEISISLRFPFWHN
jgi:putative transposase